MTTPVTPLSTSRASVASGAVVHSMYGHRCAVNFAWPWCPPAPSEQAADIHIVLGSLGRFADADLASYAPYRRRPGRAPSEPAIVTVARAPDGHLRVTYAAGAEF